MTNSAKTLSPLRAVIVDGDAHLRALLRSQLYALGLRDIFDAADGTEALEKIRRVQPSLVICNLAVAHMDGIALTRHLRLADDSPNPYIPIVLLVKAAERGRLAEALEAGVTAVLAIPFTAETLRTHLIELVEHPKPYVRIGAYFGPERRPRANETPSAAADRRPRRRTQ